MELKAYLVYTPMDSTAEGLYELDSINIEGKEVYLADEADKVISEKDEEIRHQKYKRCLAMAAICWERRWRVEFDYSFWHKWGNRWLELAEKFKEAK